MRTSTVLVEVIDQLRKLLVREAVIAEPIGKEETSEYFRVWM